MLFAAISLIATSGNAQVSSSGIRGKVLDPTRAAIVKARVKITSTPEPNSTLTDQEGAFSISLTPGTYTIEFTAEGFASLSRQITVSAGQFESIEAGLSLPLSTATVTVVASDAFGYRTEAVTSATKTLSSLRDLPQSISVINTQQIKDQAMAGIADVVNYVPGITSHQGENNRDQIVIRGNSSSADFFLNGMRDDVQYYRDLYNVEQVEALKGPNAMSFGRGGGGGVINRVTKEAGFTRLRAFVFQGGSFHDKRVTADLNQPLNQKFAFRVNGLYEHSGSFRRFVGLERYGINPTLTFTPGSKTRITIGFEHFYDGRVADRGIPSYRGRPADVAISTYYGDPNQTYVRARVNLLSGLIEHQIGKFNFRNRTQFGHYERAYQNFVPGAVNPTRTLVNLSAYNNATTRRNFFNQTDLTYPFSTGKIKHTFLGGAELGRQSTGNFRNTGFFNNTTTLIQVPYDDPLISTRVTFRQSATDANNHVRNALAAIYVQDQMTLSRRVQAIAGVRYDYFDLRFHNNRNGEDLRRIDRLASPRAGIVFKPVTPLSLYGSYGVSYLPSSGDQFSSLTTITQQVKPEKFTNYEAGAKWDIRRSLTLTAAAYRQDRTNTRAVDPADPTRILQTGSQRTKGFELGLNGSITRRWRVAGGYSSQNAAITSATVAAPKGAQVAMVPHHSFSLWNNYQVTSRLALGLGVTHRSDMFAAIDNSVVLPGYTRADAAAFFNFNERWRLQANVTNLFNRTYYLNADGNNNISPGSPRSARISLTASF